MSDVCPVVRRVRRPLVGAVVGPDQGPEKAALAARVDDLTAENERLKGELARALATPGPTRIVGGDKKGAVAKNGSAAREK